MANAFTDTTAFALQIEKALDAQVRWALRAQPIFRPLIDFRPGILTNPGQPVKLLIEPFLALQKSALPETSDPDTVALGAPTVVNVSPTERGASVVTTLRLEDLAYTDVAMQRARLVGTNMIDSVDDLVKDVYDTGTNISTIQAGVEKLPASGSTGTAVASIAAGDKITGDFIAHNVAVMRTRLAMPKEADGSYAAVVHPNVSVDIQREAITNASFVYVHANGGDLSAIYNGEVGKWLGVRFVESPKVNKAASGAAGASVYTTYLLGREAVVEHVVREPHIVVGNFGRDSFPGAAAADEDQRDSAVVTELSERGGFGRPSLPPPGLSGRPHSSTEFSLSCTRGCCASPREHYRSLTTTVGLDTAVQNTAMARLDKYEDATRQGIQPRTTGARDIDAAVRISDVTGVAFRGDQL